MTALGQLELLKRLGSVPLDPLVDALRELHRRGATDSEQLRALLAPKQPLPTAPQALTGEVDVLHPRGENYEAARKHFVQHAQRLRQQALLAEQLLDGFVRPQSAPGRVALHRELTMACPRGAKATAGFVIANSLRRAVQVRFEVGPIHGRTDGLSASELVSFDPSTLRLPVGAEQQIRLNLDLTRRSMTADAIEFGVDVLGDDQLLVKMWVSVRLTEK